MQYELSWMFPFMYLFHCSQTAEGWIGAGFGSMGYCLMFPCLFLMNLNHTLLHVFSTQHSLLSLVSEQFILFHFFVFVYLFRQGLIYPRLSLNLLCSPGWPQTHDPLASTAWVLGLWMCTTTPVLYSMVIEPRVLCMVGILSDVLYPSPTSPQFIFLHILKFPLPLN